MFGSYNSTFVNEDRTLEDTDVADVLPNAVQLIETRLIPKRSANWNQLSGAYLFCQIYSARDCRQICLMCRNYHYSLSELKQHYQAFHDIAVHTSKAELDEDAPSECTESPDLVYESACCKATFRTLTHLADHYLRWHETASVVLLKHGATLLKKCFYCSFCGEPMDSFSQCLQHLKASHGKKTFVCSYCMYCSPMPVFLRNHEFQRHVQHYSEALVQCSVCSIHVRGTDRLTKHLMTQHVVQTGTNYWSCTNCLRTFKDPRELMEHLETCFKRYQDSEATFNQASCIKSRIIFTCDSCPLVFASEEEFEKHENEENHIVGSPEKMIQSSMNMDDTRKCDPELFDCNTCFLCCMRFPTAQLVWKHHHHVHMQWMTKGEAQSGQLNENGSGTTQDIEELESSNILEPDLRNEHVIVPVIEYVLENDIPSFMDFVEQQLAEVNGQLPTFPGTSETIYVEQEINVHDQPSYINNPPEKPSGSPEVMVLDIEDKNNNNNSAVDINKEMLDGWEVCKINACSDVAFGGIKMENELADIGFPPKFGHFCHLCDKVIRNYWFYYLHMRDFHQLAKRFKCVVTECGKVFSGTPQFKDHAFRVHNQKSHNNCRMCDVVFGDEVELQNHLSISSHVENSRRVGRYGRPYPRNHKCSICNCWIGLFSSFVEHMETNGHIYINSAN